MNLKLDLLFNSSVIAVFGASMFTTPPFEGSGWLWGFYWLFSFVYLFLASKSVFVDKIDKLPNSGYLWSIAGFSVLIEMFGGKNLEINFVLLLVVMLMVSFDFYKCEKGDSSV